MLYRLICCFVMSAAGLASAATLDFDLVPAPPRDLPQALRINENSPIEQLRDSLRQQIETDPEDAAAWYELGIVRFRLSNVETATEAWQRAHELDRLYAPADVMLETQRIFKLVEDGKAEEARTALENAQKRFDASPYFHLIRAEQAMRSRAFDAAENAYRSAIEADPNFFAAKLNSGRYLEYVGRQGEARRSYIAATQDAPDNSMAWDFLGAHQFSGGEIDSALESFQKAEAVGRTQQLAELRLANLFKTAGDLIGARHWYRKALERATEPQRDVVLVALGDTQLRLGLLDEAAETLDEAIKRAPSAPVLVARGFVAEENGDVGAAIKFYRRAVKADPGNIVASNNLSMALIRNGENSAEALAFSRQALERTTSNAKIAATYAVALAHDGKDEDALVALRRNLRISPEDPWIRYFLGVLLRERGMDAEAAMHLEAAIILDPDFGRRAEIEQLLAQ